MRLASVILAAALALAVGLWILAAGDGSGGAAARNDALIEDTGPAQETIVSVRTLISAAQPLKNTVKLRGVTEAARRVEVRAQTSGLVISEPLERGAQVRKDTLLCELEIGDRAAHMAEAKAQLARAKADAEASRRLSAKGYSASTKAAADQAALESARAAVDSAKRDLARTKIVAPFDGVLEDEPAELGAFLERGALCATVTALDPIHVVGYAPERQVDALLMGAEAEARLINGRTFAAKLSYVARTADAETRTFRIEAKAPNPNGDIRDGLTAELIVSLPVMEAHFAPHTALVINSEGVEGVMLAEETVNGHAARFAAIQILRDSEEGLWLAGLPEETEIIVVGQDYVTDGASIALGARMTPEEARERFSRR